MGDNFLTFLEIAYEVTREFDAPNPYEFDPVVQAIVPAYNVLIQEFDDPFNRNISAAELVSLENRDEALNRHRQLQGLNTLLIAVIQISGRCARCRRNSRLSNDVSGRRRRLAKGDSKKGPRGKASTSVDVYTSEPTSAPT